MDLLFIVMSEKEGDDVIKGYKVHQLPIKLTYN